ncbi:MAG: thiamine pyrophosphate-dependent enzyme [Pseudomonadota bacterium]
MVDPEIDWIRMAGAMGVEAGRADSCEAFQKLLEHAIQNKGPFLIEARIP